MIFRLLKRYSLVLEHGYTLLERAASSSERVTGLGPLGLAHPNAQDPSQFDLGFMHWVAGNLRAAASGINYQKELVAFLRTWLQRGFVPTKQSPPDRVARNVDAELGSLEDLLAWQRDHYRNCSMRRARAQLDGVST